MSEDTAHLTPGTILADRYELTSEIGRGGFGYVYRARQVNVDREVAVKILPPQFMSIPDVVDRFKREARLASKLSHPNTITIHDYGQQDNILFIVMELLRGEDLADVLKNERKVALPRLMHITTQVLRSLAEAHDEGIVHRDLKPENIFLSSVGTDSDFVKVLDFGIAKLAMPDGQPKATRQITMLGSTVGTPVYMSPEQAAGEAIDHRSDLYTLGVIMYEMACGRPPFHDDNPVKVMRAHLFEQVPPFEDPMLQDTPLQRVIFRALEKEREDRFQSAREFLEELTELHNLSGLGGISFAQLSEPEEPPTLDIPSKSLAEVRQMGERLPSGASPFSETASFDRISAPRRAPSPLGEQSDPMLSMFRTGERPALAADAIPFGALHQTNPQGLSRPMGRTTPEFGLDKLPDLPDLSTLTGRYGSSGRVGAPHLSGNHSSASGLHSRSSVSSILTVLDAPADEDEVIVLGRPKELGAAYSDPLRQSAEMSALRQSAEMNAMRRSAEMSAMLRQSAELDALPPAPRRPVSTAVHPVAPGTSPEHLVPPHLLARAQAAQAARAAEDAPEHARPQTPMLGQPAATPRTSPSVRTPAIAEGLDETSAPLQSAPTSGGLTTAQLVMLIALVCVLTTGAAFGVALHQGWIKLGDAAVQKQ